MKNILILLSLIISSSSFSQGYIQGRAWEDSQQTIPMEKGIVLIYDIGVSPHVLMDSIPLGKYGPAWPDSNQYRSIVLDSGIYIAQLKPDTSVYDSVSPSFYGGSVFKWQDADTIAIPGPNSQNNIGKYIAALFFEKTSGMGIISGAINEGNFMPGKTEGDPIPDVDIVLEQIPGGEIRGAERTDRHGAFMFTGLKGGSYKLYVDISGIPTQDFEIEVPSRGPTTNELKITVDSALIVIETVFRTPEYIPLVRPGVTWTIFSYDIEDPWIKPCERTGGTISQVRISADTFMYNGNMYFKLAGDLSGIREDSLRRVYVLNFNRVLGCYNIEEEEHLLFDFSQLKDDTIIIDGVTRRFYIDSTSIFGREKIVEGIGSLKAGLFLECVSGLGYAYDLVCFQDDTINYISPFGAKCNMCTSNTSPTAVIFKPLTVLPNPSKGIFTIVSNESIGYPVQVFTINGKLLYVSPENFNGRATIDITSFDKGIYYVQINNRSAKLIYN